MAGALQKHTRKMVEQAKKIATLERVVKDLQKRMMRNGMGDATLGAGGMPPGLMNEEEFVWVRMTEAVGPGQSGAAVRLTPDFADDEDTDPIEVFIPIGQSAFEGCIGLARYRDYYYSEPDYIGRYVMLLGEAAGFAALITGASTFVNGVYYYPWAQVGSWPGLDPKTSDDFGPALSMPSVAFDTALASRMTMADLAIVALRYSVGLPWQDTFYFSVGAESPTSLCTPA